MAPKSAMTKIMPQQTKSQHVTGRGFGFLSITPALPLEGVFFAWERQGLYSTSTLFGIK